MPAGTIDTIYQFDSMTIPSGVLKLKLLNDSGVGGVLSPAGNFILSFASINESVEENGIGGILRIPDIEIEMYDRANLLKGTIFDTATVTRCDASVILNVGGTDYGVLIGHVDLSTIVYTTYYDDEAGTESHSCKFVIFSLLKQLDEVSVETLRTEIDTYKVTKAIHISLESAHSSSGVTAVGSALGGSSGSWVSPSAAIVQDMIGANVSLSSLNDYSNYLKVTGFFTSGIIPTGSTIVGIKFTIVMKRRIVAGIDFQSVKFVKGGSISGNELATSGDTFSIVYAPHVIGSTTELAGLSWTPADCNASDFGIAIAIKKTSSTVSGVVVGDVDYVQCDIYYETTIGDRFCVKEVDILDAIQTQLGYTNDAVTHSIAQTFRHVDSIDATANGGYADLWHIWTFDGGAFDTEYDTLWIPNFTGSLSMLSSASEILKALCGMRLSYPILIYTASNGHINLKIKQRGAGTLHPPSHLGTLKESTLQSFAGYDCFKASFVVGTYNAYSPSTIDSTQFNLLTQKLSFNSYFGITFNEVLDAPAHYMWVTDGSRVSNVNHLIDEDTTDYISFADFILTNFENFWGSPALITRTYSGVGIGGANPIEILDRISVDGVNYTIIEITRDFLNDEMTVRAVSY